MKKMIAVINPFVLKQNLYVYEDGNTIDIANPKMSEFPIAILDFMEKYEVTQINLMGPKQYNRGLSKQIKEAELTKFNENKLKINIV